MPKAFVWPCVSGVVVLVLGVVAAKRELWAAARLDKLIVLRRVFIAAPLAVFGAEHLVLAQSIMQLVPAWMPARLFWVYFVAVALIGAALSLSLGIRVRLAATLLAIMFFLFVVMIHVPDVAVQSHERLFWNLALRDLAFGGGALVLAGSDKDGGLVRWSSVSFWVGRVCIAVALVVFGVDQILHPQFAPGVPLDKLTPAWVRGPHVWALLTGLVWIGGGVGILIRRYCRDASTAVGLVMTLLTLFFYLPVLLMASGSSELVEGLNYVADTLLFGGSVLLVAAAGPKEAQAGERL